MKQGSNKLLSMDIAFNICYSWKLVPKTSGHGDAINRLVLVNTGFRQILVHENDVGRCLLTVSNIFEHDIGKPETTSKRPTKLVEHVKPLFVQETTEIMFRNLDSSTCLQFLPFSQPAPTNPQTIKLPKTCAQTASILTWLQSYHTQQCATWWQK